MRAMRVVSGNALRSDRHDLSAIFRDHVRKKHGYLPNRHGYLPNRHGYLANEHGCLPGKHDQVSCGHGHVPSKHDHVRNRHDHVFCGHGHGHPESVMPSADTAMSRPNTIMSARGTILFPADTIMPPRNKIMFRGDPVRNARTWLCFERTRSCPSAPQASIEAARTRNCDSWARTPGPQADHGTAHMCRSRHQDGLNSFTDGTDPDRVDAYNCDAFGTTPRRNPPCRKR